ncbi:GIY-YIG nuclease family protein [Candidatus Omnitrophota bacterium]
MSYYVYVLISNKDGNFYIGISENPERRLSEHNNGFSKSTKPRRPFVLVHKEQFDTRAEARKREKSLKSGEGRELLKSFFK